MKLLNKLNEIKMDIDFHIRNLIDTIKLLTGNWMP
jgi:hypothetical protein